MPWANTDATRHTKKANTPKRKRAWAKIANSVRGNSKYGRTPKSREGAAVRIANAAIKRVGNSKSIARKSTAKKKHGNAGKPKSAAHRAAISKGLRRFHRS